MLHLRRSIRPHLLSSPVYPLHRLLSSISTPNTGFVLEDYLAGTCGLTRAQALNASAKISHLKSPSNPNAVLAFLADLGLSGADVAALIAKDPQFLCASVERTLTPVVVGLTGLGLSRSEVARLASLSRGQFRCMSIVSNLQYCLHLFGSFENLFPVLKHGLCLLSADLETVVKPNAALLRGCVLDDSGFAKLCRANPWLLASSADRIRTMLVCAQGIGVPFGSPMFRHALHAVAFLSEEKIAARVDHLKKTFRWTDADVTIALSKAPFLLRKSKESLWCRSEFCFSELGLEPSHIAHQPVMLAYDLEGRMRPRYYVVKFLKENGLLKSVPSYNSIFKVSGDVFLAKFICPHKEAAPQLAEDYAASCRGEVPSNFRFT